MYSCVQKIGHKKRKNLFIPIFLCDYYRRIILTNLYTHDFKYLPIVVAFYMYFDHFPPDSRI